jgi:hypothetical protein
MSIILGSYSTLRCKFNKDPPHENNINRQFYQSEETGSSRSRILIAHIHYLRYTLKQNANFFNMFLNFRIPSLEYPPLFFIQPLLHLQKDTQLTLQESTNFYKTRNQ